MIFTKNIIKDRTIKWKRKFAFFPKEIKRDLEKDIKTIVWFGWYEEKYEYMGYISEWRSLKKYRIPTKGSWRL